MQVLGIYTANVLEILQSCTKPTICILLPQYANHDILINWYYTFCVFFAGFCLAVWWMCFFVDCLFQTCLMLKVNSCCDPFKCCCCFKLLPMPIDSHVFSFIANLHQNSYHNVPPQPPPLPRGYDPYAADVYGGDCTHCFDLDLDPGWPHCSIMMTWSLPAMHRYITSYILTDMKPSLCLWWCLCLFVCLFADWYIEAWTKWLPFCRQHFKYIFFPGKFYISFKISIKFVPKGPIDQKLALVQIMAWHLAGNKPLLELMVAQSLHHMSLGHNELTM